MVAVFASVLDEVRRTRANRMNTANTSAATSWRWFPFWKLNASNNGWNRGGTTARARMMMLTELVMMRLSREMSLRRYRRTAAAKSATANRPPTALMGMNALAAITRLPVGERGSWAATASSA